MYTYIGTQMNIVETQDKFLDGEVKSFFFV